MQNIRFRAKIRIFTYTLLATFVVVGAVSFGRMAETDAEMTGIQENWMPSVVALARLRGRIQVLRHAVARHVMSTGDADRWDQTIRSTQEEIRASWSDYQKLITKGTEERLAAAVAEPMSKLDAQVKATLDASRGDK